MHLISAGSLKKAASKYPDVTNAIKAFCKTIEQAKWQNLIEVQQIYREAEAVGNFTVFNIKGNKYRLIIDIDYEEQVAYFKYFLTHAEYAVRPRVGERRKGTRTEEGNGKMTVTINREDYWKLLREVKLVPKVIETETEYEENLAVAEKLIAKKKNRSEEETTLLRLLVRLIEDYEEANYNLEEWNDIPPHEILQHLLEVSQTKQSDLVGIISPSKGLISAIVNGKRAISKEQAKKLGEYFKISPSLFI